MSKSILGLSLFIAFIIFIPTLYGFLNPPENLYFITLDGEDEYNHLTWLYQAIEGRWTFRSPYILTPHEGTLFQPLYLFEGKIAGLLQGFLLKAGSLSLAPIYIYNFFRPLSAFFLLTSIFLFICHLTSNPWKRLFLFLFTAFSGGNGWMAIFHPSFPTTFGTLFLANNLNDANTFFTMESYPHLAISQALMVCMFLLFLKYLKTKNLRLIIVAGFAALLLLFIHPYNFPTVYLIPTAFLLLSSSQKNQTLFHFKISKFCPVIGIFLISFWAPLYYAWLVQTDPGFAAWSTVKDVTYPPHRMFLPVFGLLNILALIGCYQVLKSKKGGGWRFLIVWIVIQSFLLYAPFNFQRRLVNGLHIPVALLSAFGVWETVKLWPKKIRLASLALIFLASSLSAPFYIYKDIAWLKVGSQRNFLSQEVLEGLGWLSINTTLEETVLGPPSEISFAIPALGGNQIFYGHWFKPEIDEMKKKLMQSFFSTEKTTDPDNVSFLNTKNAKNFLTHWGIKFVFLDKNQFPDFDTYYPSQIPYLQKQFENKTVAIYKTLL